MDGTALVRTREVGAPVHCGSLALWLLWTGWGACYLLRHEWIATTRPSTFPPATTQPNSFPPATTAARHAIAQCHTHSLLTHLISVSTDGIAVVSHTPDTTRSRTK